MTDSRTPAKTAKAPAPRSGSGEIDAFLRQAKLSMAQPGSITIPRGTEVSTTRVDGSEQPIVFTTESDLVIAPAEVVALKTRASAAGEAGWTTHNLGDLKVVFDDNGVVKEAAGAPTS